MPYVTFDSYARVRAVFDAAPDDNSGSSIRDRLILFMNDGKPYPKSIALTPRDVALIDTLESLGKLP